MALTIRADSTEYVYASITADHDITGDVISVATPEKGLDPTTWTATTVTQVVDNGGSWTATYRILMGPNGGDVSLSAGSYDWIVKVTDNPEQPVRKAGSFTVV